MFSKSPDSSVRGHGYAAVFWLLLGSSLLVFAALKSNFPDFMTARALSYGRLQAAATIAFLYGWLTHAGLAVVYFAVPRTTGARIASEPLGQMSGALIDAVVALGVAVTFFGGAQGPAFSELPPYLDGALAFALLLSTVNIFRTVAARIEPRLYSSVWYFAGALIWGPLSLVAGNLHSFSGVPESIAHLFSINTFFLLWSAAMGMGALVYMLPRATEGPLHSHRLATIAFWSLAFAAPLSSQSRQVFGPAPDWLETVGIGAAIALLIPALTTLANTLGTLRGAWNRVMENPSVLFLVGGSVLFVGAIGGGALGSLRAAARNIGATEWVTGQIWLLLGASTLWFLGSLVFIVPRVVGRKWFDARSLAISFWLTAGGSVGIALAALGAGIVTAAILVAGNANENPLAAGRAFDVILNGVRPFRFAMLSGLVVFAVAQWLFGINLFRTSTRGESRGLEIVVSEEAL